MKRMSLTTSELAAIERQRAESQTEETRGLIGLAQAHILPTVVAQGWVCRYVGEDGLGCFDRGSLRFIHSIAQEEDGRAWAHASLSRRDKSMPEWSQVRDLWWLLYPDVVGIIVVAPRTEHVNKAEVAHVWGCLTERIVPDFTHGLGSI